MASRRKRPETNPFLPSETEADWEAQGWAKESVPTTAARRLEASISIRLGPDDAATVRRAARLRATSLSEFVRQATVREAAAVAKEAEAPLRVTRFVTASPPPATGTEASASTTGSPRTTSQGARLVPRAEHPTAVESVAT